MAKPRAMDPDRYQMRDLKRRVASLEKENIYKSASLTRFAAVLKETRGALVAVDLQLQEVLLEIETLQMIQKDITDWVSSASDPVPPTQRSAAKDGPP